MFETTLAIGNFDHISIATSMFASFLIRPRGVLQNLTVPLGSTTGPTTCSTTRSIWNENCLPLAGFKFYLVQNIDVILVPFAM